MATAVDSIEIPGEFLELAANWTGGQGDMLYAIVSSGGLKLGTLRPYDDHEGATALISNGIDSFGQALAAISIGAFA